MFEPLHSLLRSPGWFGGAEVDYLPPGDARPHGKHSRDPLGRTAPALPSHLPAGDGERGLLPCSLWLFLPPSRLQQSRGSTPGRPAGTQEGRDPCREPQPRDSHQPRHPALQPSPQLSFGAAGPVFSTAVATGPSTLQHLGSCGQRSYPAALQMCWKVPLLESRFSPALLPTSGRSAPLQPSARGGGSLFPTSRMPLCQGRVLEAQEVLSMGTSEHLECRCCTAWFGRAEILDLKADSAVQTPR